MEMKGRCMMDIFLLILYSFMVEEIGKAPWFLLKVKAKELYFYKCARIHIRS